MDGTVLVADDDRTIRTVLTQALTRAGCRVHATSSLVTLLRWVDEGRGDLVITDVIMPDGNGLEQVPEIAQKRPGLPVIVISAQNTIMTAIQAAEAEAFDYLPKPFDLPDLMKRAGKALAVKRRSTAPDQPREIGAEADLPLVGRTPVMQGLFRLVARVLHIDIPVLLSGESGTGKSLIARAIHDFSDRRSLPFVVAEPADLEGMEGPATLLAKARGGTLVFDAVEDLDGDAQAKVVRLLDACDDTSPRIMATSQTDLSKRLEDGDFRRDLYYRLCGVPVSVPSLRERIDDIADLAEHFLLRAERDGQSQHRLSGEAKEIIRKYRWPGNVRQLENLIKSLSVTAQGMEITGAEVSALLGDQPVHEPPISADGEKLNSSVMRHLRRYFELHGGVLPPAGLYARILREIEVPLIEISLEATSGNQAKCADLLGINRNTLRKKITELEIHVARGRKLM